MIDFETAARGLRVGLELGYKSAKVVLRWWYALGFPCEAVMLHLRTRGWEVHRVSDGPHKYRSTNLRVRVFCHQQLTALRQTAGMRVHCMSLEYQ